MNHLVPVYAHNGGDGTRFAARPIRHWRKQYLSTSISTSNMSNSTSNMSIGMPMDRPGGMVPVANETIHCMTCRAAASLKDDLVQDISVCKSCNPIKPNTQLSEKMYNDTQAYLSSRCLTYDQKLSITKNPAVAYFSPDGRPSEPSDSVLGAQVRETNNCFNHNCTNTIYKPNNSQYAQQGAVSSGSRLARLKYNTLNQYGAMFNSAAGAVGVNSGRYQTEPSPSYYVKNKPQKITIPYKIGAKSYCRTEYSMCMYE